MILCGLLCSFHGFSFVVVYNTSSTSLACLSKLQVHSYRCKMKDFFLSLFRTVTILKIPILHYAKPSCGAFGLKSLAVLAH